LNYLGYFLHISVFLLSLHLAGTTACAKTPLSTLDGIVLKVSEGDEITVNANGTEIKVRLYGIDAPETEKFDNVNGGVKRGQAFGDASFKALAHKVLHHEVRLEMRRRIHHNKELCVVWIGDRNIDLEMVTEGWAWFDSRHADRSGNAEYQAAEKNARARKLGLWIQDNPLPPWEFRKMLKRITLQKH
jgi:endonuclease YncB( thermonuclease family)